MSQLIQVRVNDQLTLDMGTLAEGEHEGEIVVRPPAVPLVDQLIGWLHTCPAVPDKHIDNTELSRGALALTLRWGSWFALLADPNLPQHRRSRGWQRITNPEMARINIEASAAMERWFSLRRDDPATFRQITARAATYLPDIPERQRHERLPKHLRAAASEAGLGVANRPRFLLGGLFWSATAPRLGADLQEARPETWSAFLADAEAHPLRMIANSLIFTSWRMNGVEPYHEGRPYEGPLLARRLSSSESTRLMRAAVTDFYIIFRRFDDLFEERGRTWAEKALPFHALAKDGSTDWNWSLAEASKEMCFANK